MYKNIDTALTVAKEITIAALQNTEMKFYDKSGEDVATFFEAIYRKYIELKYENGEE